MQASIPALYPAHKAKGDGGRRGDPRRGAGVGPRATLPVEAAAQQGDGGGRDETREVGAMRESEAGGAGVRGEEGDGAAGGGGARRRIRAAWAMCVKPLNASR